MSAPAPEQTQQEPAGINIEDVPLFASSAPDSETMGAAFEALVHVMDEGTPTERALGLREQGNAAFKRGGEAGLREAIDCYTRSVAVSGVEDPLVHAVTLCDRAAAHLKLGNYGSCVGDCEASLAAAPHLYKSHYRAADALRRLRRYPAAIAHCDAALADAETPAGDVTKRFETLKVVCQAEAAREAAAAAAREKAGGSRFAEIERDAVEELQRRGIKIGDSVVDTAQLAAQSNGALVTRLVEAVDENDRVIGRVLSMPVVILYEEEGIVDCIAAFPETKTLAELLVEMFREPPAWDTHKKYRRQTVEMYVELRGGAKTKLARLKPTSTLGNLLSHPAYVLPRMPAISIVSTASKAFRKKFLSKYQ